MIPNPADGSCMLRHERMTVAMALAEALHHTAPRGQKTARAGEEESETKYTAKFRATPPPQPVLFSLYDEEPGGGRPEAFAEPRPQARVQRHTMEHITDLMRVAPMVQILDAPVPQTGDQLPDILSFFGALLPDPEQVIEVPKLLLDDVPMRAAERDTQLGEQLVEVPTQPWYVAMVLAEKVFSRREIRRILAGMEGGGGSARRGLVLDRIQQRIWSSRSLKFQFLRIGGKAVEVFEVLSQYRIQQRLWSRSLTFQLVGVFLVFSRDRVLLPHPVVCMTLRMRILLWFFALFPVRKKVRSWARTRGRNCPPSRAHPRGELMRTRMLQGMLLAVFVVSG